MTDKNRPDPLFLAFLAAMFLIIVIGVFMLVWGSLHNVVPTPRLTGPGLYARVIPHA